MSDRPSLLLYCQHSLGMGHLVRSWALADALMSSFRVSMVAGGAPPRGLEPPSGLEVIELPAVAQNETGRLVVVNGDAPIEDVMHARQRLLLEAYEKVRPSVVVIELFPFGRRKFRGELIPLLEMARRAPRALVVCSVRDLLVDRGIEQQHHDDRAAGMLNDRFDAVMVHTDPRFSTLGETFRPSAPLCIPVLHTGFVVATRAADRPADSDRILVSGGGGRFAERLYLAAIEAHALLAADRSMLVVAGPLCPPEVVDRLRSAAAGHARVQIVSTVSDLSREMLASAVSVSQCGYNTALDIVRARVPALVVPFADNGDSEQTERASRLERLNLLRVLSPADLQPARLAAAIEQMRRFVPSAATLDLDGAACTPRAIVTMLRHAEERVLA
jgi:predicted glycosyltransferase